MYSVHPRSRLAARGTGSIADAAFAFAIDALLVGLDDLRRAVRGDRAS